MEQPSQPPRLIGYARVSTTGQDLAYQLDKLKVAGCAKVFQEKRSGKNRDERPQLARMLRSLRRGDVVLATVSDRIARDPLDMLNILHAVKKAGAMLRLIDEPFVDTTSPMADLVVYLIGWAASWQRMRILENTAHGREMARARGVKFGRPSKLKPGDKARIAERYAKGESRLGLARAFGVSERTIMRALDTAVPVN